MPSSTLPELGVQSDKGVEEPWQVEEAQVDLSCVLAHSEAVAVVGVVEGEVAEEGVAEEQEGEEEEGPEKEAESTVMVLLQEWEGMEVLVIFILTFTLLLLSLYFFISLSAHQDTIWVYWPV